MIHLELKYCECCGALLLRVCGGREAYCTGCARLLAELPKSKPCEERRGRRSKPAATAAAAGLSLPLAAAAVRSIVEIMPPMPVAAAEAESAETGRTAA